MKEMKGEIRVESEGAGKGATVTLCFPGGRQKAEATKTALALNPAGELKDHELH